jgi:hypothetical protein
LKKGGTAILLNNSLARDFIPAAGVMVKSNSSCALPFQIREERLTQVLFWSPSKPE